MGQNRAVINKNILFDKINVGEMKFEKHKKLLKKFKVLYTSITDFKVQVIITSIINCDSLNKFRGKYIKDMFPSLSFNKVSTVKQNQSNCHLSFSS